MKKSTIISIVVAVFLLVIAGFLYFATNRTEPGTDIKTKAITLLDDYSIVFGMTKQAVTDLLGEPDEVNTSPKYGYLDSITYKDIVLYGNTAKVTLSFDCLQKDQLTQIQILLCVNDADEAELLCKIIEDDLISKLRLMNLPVSQREIPGGTSFCTELATYYFDPNVSYGTEQYVDISISKN